jgi:hypothetical protein
LTEDYNELGKVTRKRTTSGLRVATKDLNGKYQLSFERTTTASFQLVADIFDVGKIIEVRDTLGGAAPPTAVLADPSFAEAGVPSKNYSHYLRLIVAAHPEGTVSLVSGKYYGDVYVATLFPYDVGAVYLSAATAGDVTPLVPVAFPMGGVYSVVKLGEMDQDGNLDFHPVQESYPPPGILGGETMVWSSLTEKFVPGSAGIGDITGPAVVGRTTADLGPASAILAPTNDRVLMRVAGTLQWLQVGTAQIADSAISTAKIALGAVTNDKIANSSVDNNKLITDAVSTIKIQDNAVTTGKVADGAITAAKLADAVAYTVVGNGTDVTGDPAGITASTDGSVLNRKGTVLNFVQSQELGTTASGGGSLRVNFAAGKYVEITSAGVVNVFHSSTAQMSISAAMVVTITYASSNTITLDPAHISGTGRAFRLREIDVCNSSGVAKKIQLLCTDLY